MLVFGLAIFTGAFLLFLVQPLIARFILPWFGGSPAVWTTCMLFFQMLLLGGYAYAHLSIRRLAPRRQVIVHLALLTLALLLLPITPGDHWKPPDGALPLWRILVLLGACLGLPYLVLSATGPLMQAWFSQAQPGVPPYRLYALSNVGSLLALISYPFLVEPNLSRRAQAGWWSAGLGLFALLAGWCGMIVWKCAGDAAGRTADPDNGSGNIFGNPGDEAATDPPQPSAPGLEAGGQSLLTPPATPQAVPASAANAGWLWFSLPACASVLLLAVTNKICQDIAVIPFLWVLPLSLYLLSFVVSFDSPRWYRRWFWLPALALALGVVLCMMLGGSVIKQIITVMLGGSLIVHDAAVFRPLRWLLDQMEDLSMFKTIGIYLGTMFVSCMVCHGEVYRLRPPAQKLTGYYLIIAAGGAFGGLFVAILAPFLFKGYFELHVGLLTAGVLAMAVLFVDRKSPLYHGRRVWAWVILSLATLGLGAGLYRDVDDSRQAVVEMSRNFYGVLKVEEYCKDDPGAHELRLLHGVTTHGLQFMAPERRRLPTSYYTGTSGVGRTMEHFPRQTNRRVGVVGLGTGSMAVWGKAGDYFRIYEINDAVQRLARSRFTYLGDSPAEVEVVMGDARLSMEREPDQRFDILVLDAFSSDAIPVHLLTAEAFEIYRRHLQPDGVIAVHISNRYLELQPIVLRVAARFGFSTAIIKDADTEWDYDESMGTYAYASDWVLLTKNETFLKLPAIKGAATAPEKVSPKIKMWTDEESNLFRILVADDDSWLGWLRRWAP